LKGWKFELLGSFVNVSGRRDDITDRKLTQSRWLFVAVVRFESAEPDKGQIVEF
jgi:hypothetical protein